MSTQDGVATFVGGLDLRRVAQIITTQGEAEHVERRCGSGYLVAANAVLTATHVVLDADSVLVRFVNEDGSTTSFPATKVVADERSDIALLTMEGVSAHGDPRVGGSLPVRFARAIRETTQDIDCEAVGFPRFKLRRDLARPDRDVASFYRDSRHARGTIAPGGGLRERTLEINLAHSPAPDPEPHRSPWEGMSGAVVWSGGCVIGVISAHYGAEGLGTLTARRVEQLYETLGPDQIKELNGLIGLPIDVGGLERVPRPQPLPSDEAWLDTAAKDLVESVRMQWEQEERRQSVHDPYPLPVRFDVAAPDLHDHWWKIRRTGRGTDPGPLALSGQLDEVAAVYRSIPSERLVVLGEAGSGKTILTLRFVLDRLKDCGMGARVPVIFSVGSWNPDKISLRDWMCRRMILDYPGLEKSTAHCGNLADALLDHDRILPVLDGFDEIACDLQGTALKALNYYAKPLVITSRIDQYTQAVKGTGALSAAACIRLDGLAAKDLDAYLTAAGRPGGGEEGVQRTAWHPVLEKLRERPHVLEAAIVAEALTTPLMVALARTVYGGSAQRKPSELLETGKFPTAEAVQNHLLAEFVPAAYRQLPPDSGPATTPDKRPSRSWNAENAQDWLGYLATHLAQLDTNDIEWWRFGTTMKLRARMLVVGAAVGLASWIITAVIYGLAYNPAYGLVIAVLSGLGVGLTFGLMHGFATAKLDDGGLVFRPSHLRIQLSGRTEAREVRERLRRGFLPRVGAGLAGGLLFGVLWAGADAVIFARDGYSGPAIGLYAAGTLAAGIGLGAGVGLVAALGAGLETVIERNESVQPVDLLNTNRATVLTQFLAVVLVIGTGYGIAFGLGVGPWPGVGAGSVAGLMVGLGVSTMTAWGRWVVLARIWLPLTGRAPWAMIAFLDDAHQRGVLRQAGAIYQFRHARIQTQLAKAFQNNQAKDRTEATVPKQHATAESPNTPDEPPQERSATNSKTAGNS